MGGFARAFLRPAFVFILVAAVVAFLIVGIGQLLLALHPEMAEHAVSGFAATVQEFTKSFPIPCAPSADTTIGSTCQLNTTVEALVKEAIQDFLDSY